MTTKKEKSRIGKKNRNSGKAFERKVRKDLTESGWIVFRNLNDVEFEKFYGESIIPHKTEIKLEDIKIEGQKISTFLKGEFKQAKTKWNFFTKRPMGLQSGFPDFICIGELEPKMIIDGKKRDLTSNKRLFEVQFVECKSNGTLSKEEKEKIKWIEKNLKIRTILAKKGLKRGEIIYEAQNYSDKAS